MIRPASEADNGAIRDVHVSAFSTSAEADLVDRLRANGRLLVSLVAEVERTVVGHIAFSPVTIEDSPHALSGVGLAPVAVLPKYQNAGIGRQLIESGLCTCREAGHDFAVVLGEPGYYTRFDFRPASAFDLDSQYDAGDAFMAIELGSGVLAGVGGLVRYSPEFAEIA